MATPRDTFWKYAPLWSVLFAAGTTLTKSLVTRYLLKRRWSFQWSDVTTAFVGALLGFVSFRAQYGSEDDNHWFKR